MLPPILFLPFLNCHSHYPHLELLNSSGTELTSII
jgi:hypothetical protein